MGKVIQGRFPPAFPRSRRGRKRLKPIEVGQTWMHIAHKEMWCVERVGLDKENKERFKEGRFPVKRIHIVHVRESEFPGVCWLRKNYSERHFRRSFERSLDGERIYPELCEEIRRKNKPRTSFDPDSA